MGIKSNERSDSQKGILPIGSSHSVLEAFATPRLTPRAQEAFALGGIRVSGRGRKTDYGTVILHWLLVGALSVAIVTGLRIAGEVPDRTWINVLDFVLPKAAVWTAHACVAGCAARSRTPQCARSLA